MDSIALHIPVCFDNDKPKITNVRRRHEIENLRKLVREIKVPMFISINGECGQNWIDLVYRAVAWPGSFVKEVFHRDNTGYQWGGYYDMFKMLTEFDNDWTHFATLEVDCFLMPDWLEKCLKGGYSHIGMPPFRDHLQIHYPKDWKFLKGSNHTRGGFHFCSKSLLTKVDKQFGCFTNAEGCDLTIDGILHGEVGFCLKLEKIGSGLHPIEDICFPAEFRPENLRKHKELKQIIPKKNTENIKPVIIPSEDTVRLTVKLIKETKKKKSKPRRKEVLSPEDVRLALLKKPEPEPEPKPKVNKKDGKPGKLSRYRKERNKLNANI